MGNQQVSGVYLSYEKSIEGRLYIGYSSNIDDESYLGSFRDESFKPTDRITIHKSSVPEVSYLMEYGYQKAWSCDTNKRFANQVINNYGNVNYHTGKMPNSCKKRISQSLKRYYLSEDGIKVREKISNLRKETTGWKHSEATKNKIGKGNSKPKKDSSKMGRHKRTPTSKIKANISYTLRELETNISRGNKKPMNMVQRGDRILKLQRLEAELRTLQANGSGNGDNP